MKSFISLITIILISGLSLICAQNAPLFLWGTGLDGSDFQKTGIYSDAQVGLRFEAPLTPTKVKLPIELNWRGGGVSALKILANGNVGVGVVNPTSENKHLPGIPSEKQVREEGFDVGEMNKRLLQKIEELTLYMIDMKKTNDALKVELEQLKQLIKN